MKLKRRFLAMVIACGVALMAGTQLTAHASSPFARSVVPDRPLVKEAIVIGHRGASGYLPEHTLAAYFVAIQQGADFVEPDLVSTKDGVLVARHEPEIGGTTNVSEHPEFTARRMTKVIDGISFTGWFTEDFTLAELKTLRAKERIPDLRPDNTRFDSQLEVPTFDEVLALVRDENERRIAAALKIGKLPRLVGIYPETKHPTYFDGLDLSLEEPLLKSLRRRGPTPVFIQSFETANLKALRKKTPLPLIQLIDATGKPFDFVVAGDSRTYADLITPAGLREISSYAAGIGPNKNLVIPRNSDSTLGTRTALVNDAHNAGLLVHIFTLRAENFFLPAELRLGTDPTTIGDLAGEITAFLRAGIDGFFTDQTNFGVLARDAQSSAR